MNRKFARLPLAQGIFSGMFSGGGGIAHNGNGATTVLPAANPQQQLSGAPPAPAPAPAAPAPAPAPVDPVGSQLDKFKAIWQTPTTADGKPAVPPPDPLYQPIFNIKPEDIQKGAATLDFTAGIKPELFAAIGAGGDEAIAAMKEIMNSVGRAAFAGSVMNSASLVNDGFVKHSRALDQSLPNRLRDHAVHTTTSDNPVFQHPAVEPIVNSVRTIIARNNPGMSPADAQKQTEDFVLAMTGALGAVKDGQQVAATVAKETDWLSFIGESK